MRTALSSYGCIVSREGTSVSLLFSSGDHV